MKYHLISAALILAAMVLWVSGLNAAGTRIGLVLIVAAAVCELSFWGRFLRRP